MSIQGISSHIQANAHTPLPTPVAHQPAQAAPAPKVSAPAQTGTTKNNTHGNSDPSNDPKKGQTFDTTA